ncbi:unnamed protein product [Moneuplotes crassus]|uniref:Uncharacterized protein n=1 Tax=Euplotes crassus TaxID=5936 RepID=A0AAD1X179_EUPCR|nr:unnamed protein product [Moneuplotes crassus]
MTLKRLCYTKNMTKSLKRCCYFAIISLLCIDAGTTKKWISAMGRDLNEILKEVKQEMRLIQEKDLYIYCMTHYMKYLAHEEGKAFLKNEHNKLPEVLKDILEEIEKKENAIDKILTAKTKYYEAYDPKVDLGLDISLEDSYSDSSEADNEMDVEGTYLELIREDKNKLDPTNPSNLLNLDSSFEMSQISISDYFQTELDKLLNGKWGEYVKFCMRKKD